LHQSRSPLTNIWQLKGIALLSASNVRAKQVKIKRFRVAETYGNY